MPCACACRNWKSEAGTIVLPRFLVSCRPLRSSFVSSPLPSLRTYRACANVRVQIWWTSHNEVWQNAGFKFWIDVWSFYRGEMTRLLIISLNHHHTKASVVQRLSSVNDIGREGHRFAGAAESWHWLHKCTALRSPSARRANLLLVTDLAIFPGEITSWNVHRRRKEWEVAIDHF